MTILPVTLVHPPVTKPGESPAGIARLAGALRAASIRCQVFDANIDSFHYWMDRVDRLPAHDTWSRRAVGSAAAHLAGLTRPDGYRHPDQYRRAVSDLARILSKSAPPDTGRIFISDFKHDGLSPVRSRDLIRCAEQPELTPHTQYYRDRLLPRLPKESPGIVGISLSFLSQALSGFALIGLVRRHRPLLKIILGGSLITSWMKRPDWRNPFGNWVDHLISGPGEAALTALAGAEPVPGPVLPDYTDAMELPYLSPGFVLPFSASAGCWWRRCAFCPEQAEHQAYRPIPVRIAVDHVQQLVIRTSAVAAHFLDNAMAPRLLRELIRCPPGVPWYGFVRVTAHLEDPDFCRQLAASGCVMLKIGLESGSKAVLDAMGKGVEPAQSARVLENLHRAGIAVYAYLLFGTPMETLARARETLAFTAEHADPIDFLNLAIFNMPLGSTEGREFDIQPFSEGDLALYGDFVHPLGWDRAAVRQFLDKEFRRHPAIQPILRNDPPAFSSNHAAFFTSGWRAHQKSR